MPSKQNMQQLMSNAMQLHGSGDLPGAEALYQQALLQDPQNAVALHWRGVIALQTGQPKVAAELIEEALRIAPDYQEAHTNLGNAYHSQGQYEQALECFKRALTLDPANAMLHANLGNVYLQTGDYLSAVSSYRASLSLNATLVETRRNLAMALLRTGDIDEAIQTIDEAAIQHPDSIEVAFTRGIILQESGNVSKALHVFGSLETRLPNSAPLLNNLGGVLNSSGCESRAHEYFQRAVEIDPACAEAHVNLGKSYAERGQRDKAEAHLRAAIRHAPRSGKAHHLLACLIRHASVDSDMQTMESMLSKPEMAPVDLACLGFGLGKAYEDIGEYDSAFAYFNTANAAYRGTFSYTPDHDQQIFDNIRTLFTPKFAAQLQNTRPDSSLPIFVVGMPRSGTTLIEQILDSHPQVHGAGELRYFSESLAAACRLEGGVDYTRGLHHLSSTRLEEVGRDYLTRLQALAPSTAHIVDKLPMNFFNIGIIRAALPNARIIHCRRNAVDTCVSIYKNMFAERGHTYAYNLAELGRFYRQYLNLMEHWERLYPDTLISIDYEQLVAEQERETRRLIAACELPWDDNCLDFHENQRTVRTLSMEQVRQPLYRSSVDLSRHYRPHLVALLEALEE